ncbi:MAG: hypothetical protein HDT01_06315 [Bacteroidales bacterium]|nr:hypothetical protein [Bacteroidales bacterium]
MFPFNNRRQVTPAQVIQQLLDEGRLQEARREGEKALSTDGDNDELIEALVEVYLRLEMECLESGVTSILPRITERISELLPQLTTRRGELGERHNELVRKSLPGYSELAKFESLSVSSGREQEAYEQAKAFLNAQNADIRLLPMFGTILSRYLRVAAAQDDSTVSRKLLAEFLSLPLQKPSRLYSLVMRQAVRMARKFPEFKFGRFVKMWDPSNFRAEDVRDPEGKLSLAVAVFEILLDSDDVDMMPDLLARVHGNDSDRMEILRGAFARLVDRNFKEGNNNRGCELLSLYARHASLHVPCRQHSRMLEMALLKMEGENEWRFPEFFINWGSENFMKADFETKSTRAGGTKISLVNRALRRCCNIAGNDIPRYSYLLNQLLASVDTIIRLSPQPGDELLRRRRAGIISMLERPDLALAEYGLMARKTGCSAAFWTEYADMVKDHSLKASLFALALSRNNLPEEEKAQLKLYLARELHFTGRDCESAGLLTEYSSFCTSTAAEPLPVYGAIKNVIPDNAYPRLANEQLYHALAADALDFIYGELPVRKFSVLFVEGENLIVSDTVQELTVSTLEWPLLERLIPGSNLEIKCEGENVVMARACGGKPYDALKKRMAICIEAGRVVCAGTSEDIPCKGNTVAGRCYEVSIYRREGFGWHAVMPEPVNVVDARSKFNRMTAAVYELLPGVKYTCGAGGENGIIPASLNRNFEIGEIVDLYYYETDSTGRVIFSVTEAIDPGDCNAVRVISAPLKRFANGEWHVGDSEVPATIVDESLKDAYVKACAVYNPEREGWMAFEIVPYES